MIRLHVRPTKKPAKVVASRWETHIYLGEQDFKKLLAIAKRESRSTTSQVQHFVREGMARYLQREDLSDE